MYPLTELNDMRKKLATLSAIFIGLFLLHSFCRWQTDGFRLSHLPLRYGLSVNPIPKKEIVHAFDQPFYYLGRGAQAYAFVSEDQKYVIKFFKQDRATHPLEPIGFMLPPPFKSQLAETVAKRREKVRKDFASYQLAYDFLTKETGLLYLHLRPTGRWDNELTLYDKLGVRHKISVDQTAFVLQEKAELVYPTLKQWVSDGNTDKAKRGLTNLVGLLQRRCERGIFDKNPDLKTNFGFREEEAIQFDIGRFSPDPSRQDPRIYRDDLVRITDRLCHWLDGWAPELSVHIRDEIAKIGDRPWYR